MHQYERKGSKIKNLETGEVTEHISNRGRFSAPSTNLAKKASRNLQTNGLGRGQLRVVTKFSKKWKKEKES